MIPIGVNLHHPPPSHLDLARDTRFACGRLDFNWLDIEQEPDVFAWDRFDRMVYGMRARDLEVFATLAYTPPWLGHRRSVPPKDRWLNFVRQVATRYNHNIWHWGIWNEPNSNGFWDGTAQDYIETLLLPASQLLHEIDPNNRVIAPDLTHNDTWKVWLRQIMDPGHAVDYVSHHIYHENGREVLRRLNEVYRIARKPIWLTETGLNTKRYSEAQQANCIDQLLEVLPQYLWITRVFLFNLADESPEGGPGLYRSDLSPKPAVEVIKRRLSPA